MLPQAKINEIVGEVATAYLTSEIVDRVISEPSVDSAGNDAVKITIVIKPDAIERLKGDPILDALLAIHDKLNEAGEERFPMVHYATQAELDEVDESEP
jgi:hypothetical protein